jgi:anti-sigma factor RsiW
MTCTNPTELNDKELLAYVDGEADPQVISHVEQCPDCQERAKRLARWQGQLTAQLYRFTCPSSLELGEYHLGLLARDETAAMAQHLAECPHCTREVAQLKDYLGELAPSLEPSLLEQVKVVIARLVGGGTGDDLLGRRAWAPAYAGIRGQEEGPYLYEAGQVQISIEIQEDAETPGQKAILGLIIGAEPATVLAHLWRAAQHLVTVSVDELGNFVIPNLSPDNYELILSSPETEIHVQDLQVGMT